MGVDDEKTLRSNLPNLYIVLTALLALNIMLHRDETHSWDDGDVDGSLLIIAGSMAMSYVPLMFLWLFAGITGSAADQLHHVVLSEDPSGTLRSAVSSSTPWI